jgi:hypothetical protein
MELKIDPDIANLFAKLDEQTYYELKEDIRQHDIHDALIVAEDGTIVCGHQRYAIWKELGRIEPPLFKIQHFQNKNEMIEFAIKDNILRHHLNKYQRGLLALRLVDYEKKEAESRRGTRTDLMEPTSVKDFTQVAGRTDEKLSEIIGISSMTIFKVRKIELLGTNELKLQCQKGDISVSAAYSLLHWGTPKLLRVPIFSETKLLSPAKIGERYVICTDVPEECLEGVRVRITRLTQLKDKVRCKREYTESEIKKVLEISVPSKENRQFENCLKMDSDKIQIIFAKEGQAEKVQSFLEEALEDEIKLESKEALKGSFSKKNHSIFISYKTQSQLKREKLQEFVKDFLRTNCPLFFPTSPNQMTPNSGISQSDREFVSRVLLRQKEKGITFDDALIEVGEEIRLEDKAEFEKGEQELKEELLEIQKKSEEAEQQLAEEIRSLSQCRPRERRKAIRALRRKYGERILKNLNLTPVSNP